MIRVPFDPEKLTGQDKEWWDHWSGKAQRKTNEYLANRSAGIPCDLDGAIWSELKAWLIETVFHGKCAYCEAKVSAVSFGDAEHYRPKGNVTVVEGEKRNQVRLGSGAPHAGYYWLAYDWQNLVPACTRCNNAKSDQFEVDADYVGEPAPDTLSLNRVERPRLIYPYDDDPSEFLRFGKAGVVTAIDGNVRGTATIRMLALNRRELMEERWREQSRALQALKSEVGQLLVSEDALREQAEEYMGPRAPFSRAVHDWFVERVRVISARAAEAAKAAQTKR